MAVAFNSSMHFNWGFQHQNFRNVFTRSHAGSLWNGRSRVWRLMELSIRNCQRMTAVEFENIRRHILTSEP
jgi:hypothetical protein